MKQKYILTKTAVQRFVKDLKSAGIECTTYDTKHGYFELRGLNLRIRILNYGYRPAEVHVANIDTFDRWANSLDFKVIGIPCEVNQFLSMVERLINSHVWGFGSGCAVELPCSVFNLLDEICSERLIPSSRGLIAWIDVGDEIVGGDQCRSLLYVKRHRSNQRNMVYKGQDCCIFEVVKEGKGFDFNGEVLVLKSRVTVTQ